MTESRPPSTGPAQKGATPVSGEHRNGRKRGLLFGALLLAALVALALLLSQCGGNDPSGSADEASRTSAGADGSGSAASDASGSGSGSSGADAGGSGSASGSSGAPGAGGGAAAGSGAIVTGDGQSVLDLVGGADAAAALGGVTGKPVTGTGVRVLSVPADEGFWVGTSDTQRVWVQLTGQAGESPYQVKEGDNVDFDGTVAPHDQAFAGEVGVDDAEGAAQLSSQGQHLEVAKAAVKLAA